MRIGIDFDNTIVDYDAVFLATARERGLVPAAFSGGKTALRDAIRRGPGEDEWTRLQAEVYGPRILQAVPYAGFAGFLGAALAAGAELFIVSHKTEFAAADPDGVNLRDGARAWLEANGFVGAGAIAPEAVYFEGTREEKLRRIEALGVEAFIDDLAEVFEEASFPASVQRLLFVPSGPPHAQYATFGSWEAIGAAIFGLGTRPA
jgi:hypothetical protein